MPLAARPFVQPSPARAFTLAAIASLCLLTALPIFAVEAPTTNIPTQPAASIPTPLAVPLSKPIPHITPLPTTTTIAYSPASPIAWPSRVTLTATVLDQNNLPVTTGTVVFCLHRTLCAANIGPGSTATIGSAQLTSAGTATFKAFLAPGNYSTLVAIFLGTNADSTSTSASPSTALVVSGKTPTATTLTATGTPGNYSLAANVVGGGLVAPAGTLSFLDTSNSNALLTTAQLNPANAIPQFLLQSSPVVNTGPHAVAIADFNGDGYPDIAEVNYGSITLGDGNTLSILLGNGTGVYTVSSTLTVGHGPSSLATGDFNNDGIPDLAVTNYGIPNPAVNNLNVSSVTVLLGNGDGTFTQHGTPIPIGTDAWSITTGDFNNDGNLDLVVTNTANAYIYLFTSAGQTIGTAAVLLGDGAGNFSPKISGSISPDAPAGGLSVESAVGDFNRDGNLDIVTANQSTNNITVIYGNGTGALSYPSPVESTIPVGTEPVTVTVSDFNLDGNLDIAVGNYIDDTVTVLLGDGTGHFTPSSGSPFAAGQGPQTVRVGDFNNDGIPDLVVSDGNGNNFTILLGDGTGKFSPLNSPAPTGTQPYYFAAADLNGDGTTDLVSTNLGSASLTVLLGQWSGTATANNVSVPGTGTHLVDAGYPGDTTHLSSLSNTVPLTGSLSTTATTLTGSPASNVHVGQTIQLTAQVIPNTFYTHTAIGTITFYDGNTSLGAPNISANGTASVTTPPLTVGPHSFTAVYSGDTNFSTSTSPALNYLVTIPTISLTASPTTFTVQQDQATAPSTLTLTAAGGYTGSFTLQCGPVPQFSLCELSPSTINIAANGAYNSTFQLQTSGYFWRLPATSGLLWLPAFLLAAGMGLRRRRTNSLPTLFSGLFLLVALSGALAGLTSCSTLQPEFTPTGTYTVNVTVTGSGAATGFSQTIPYTITVIPLQN